MIFPPTNVPVGPVSTTLVGGGGGAYCDGGICISSGICSSTKAAGTSSIAGGVMISSSESEGKHIPGWRYRM